MEPHHVLCEALRRRAVPGTNGEAHFVRAQRLVSSFCPTKIGLPAGIFWVICLRQQVILRVSSSGNHVPGLSLLVGRVQGELLWMP